MFDPCQFSLERPIGDYKRFVELFKQSLVFRCWTRRESSQGLSRTVSFFSNYSIPKNRLFLDSSLLLLNSFLALFMSSASELMIWIVLHAFHMEKLTADILFERRVPSNFSEHYSRRLVYITRVPILPSYLVFTSLLHLSLV